MVNIGRRRSGQALTEYILILLMFSLLGIMLMNEMIGPSGNSGAINSKNGLVDNATHNIAEDGTP